MLTDTHIDVEGQFVTDSLSCVHSHCQLSLSVGAVIKQGPCRQLPVIQHGRHPQFWEGKQVVRTDGEGCKIPSLAVFVIIVEDLEISKE